MNCFRPKRSKTLSPTRNDSPEPPKQDPLETKNVKHEVLLRIPGCKVHLMDEGEALELANGDFTVVSLSDDDVFLATIIKVGDDLQWPLTKDEPVVKLDPLHYLFSLPMKDGDPLSYGVTFSQQKGGSLGLLDAFLSGHSCFSTAPSSVQNKDVNWKEFAPKIEDYNNVLAKAIAGGTGQIVKGIFKCSNAYTNQVIFGIITSSVKACKIILRKRGKDGGFSMNFAIEVEKPIAITKYNTFNDMGMVQKGGETVLTRAVEEKSGASASNSNKSNGTRKKTKINKSLKRVRKLSKMTEKMSKVMLNGVGIATGSVMKPMVRSQTGKAFLAMVPGEVLLASLDAVNKVLDAAEVAEKQTLYATSGAAVRMVSNSFGESAGEATGDVLATAGHCAGTAWNVFKIRKAINPASSVSSGVLKNAAKSRKS
ncbi:hypothetical protein RJ639_043213 [Escallonia herrerae]|uniref:Senescence domain-containing protein n=1 Tax=Escallonia herrerae TaxID=1293975 RepID=A0AA89B3Z5_9ASTE|nr:hypothetical protein RJ639_043213 [Escallonia herrerae]